ncbi:hypothetical protein, partial [Propionicimonas sp.]|uniref:hypothetical protein n=1 Tax=Propionicimonas sp. TaxID=1955623 RepID=UPI0039E5DA81
MSQNNHPHRPLMVQAPVRALDPDGLAVVTAGTIGFAVGVAVCWWAYPQLAATGRGWYLGVSVTGMVIGLLGLGFGLFRKSRRRRAGGDASTGTAVGPASPEALTTDADAPAGGEEPGTAPRRALPSGPTMRF